MDWISTLISQGCDEGVVSHCKKVAEVAAEFGGANVDDSMVQAGALMHDVGRSKTHSIRHASKGAKICRKLGCDKELIEIVRCHTGAGLCADEAVLLGLAPLDALPQSLEAKIVTHADNLVSGSREVSMCERMMKIIELPARSKKSIARLALEMELLHK